MARRTATKRSGIEKISIPGVLISDLLELEGVLKDIRYHLAVIMIPVIIVAQIRAALSDFPPNQVQVLESVNSYIRLFLSKSYPLRYVTAAVAIRRTLVKYAGDESSDPMIADWLDLVENTTGRSSTRGGLVAALSSEERLRSYRRGEMLRVVGILQSTAIHSPRRISKEIEKLNREELFDCLPFQTSDLDLDQVFKEISLVLSPDGNLRKFVESLKMPTDKVAMEESLPIVREHPTLPDTSGLRQEDFPKLPSWKQAAIKQARNLGGKR